MQQFLPVMRDHLSWGTTKFGGLFIQISLKHSNDCMRWSVGGWAYVYVWGLTIINIIILVIVIMDERLPVAPFTNMD